MINETEIRRVFERIKGNWSRFEHPPAKIREWVGAFRNAHPADLDRAVSEYIKKGKYEPRIGDIAPLLAVITRPVAQSESVSDRSEKFRYVRWQLDKGNCYIREPHARGYRTWFERVQDCDKVGLWVFGSLECDRYALRGSADSGEKIGVGEAWRF